MAMINPYRPPAVSEEPLRHPHGTATIAASLGTSLVLVPISILMIGRLRGRTFSAFLDVLLDPVTVLAVVFLSFVSAAVVFPTRKWHPLLPALVSPVVGVGLFLAFIELGYRLTN